MCILDINECSDSNGGCDHNCTNLDGSHECSCRDGFILSGDNRMCEDIDECSVDMPCGQTCVNLPGSFRCDCRMGYALISDGTCIGMFITNISMYNYLNNKYLCRC